MALLLGHLLACSGVDQPTGPEEPLPADALPSVPFPDSVTWGRGLPPLANTAHSRLLTPDTIVQTTIYAVPAYAIGQPMRIDLYVTVRDTSMRTFRGMTLALAPCPLVLRLYRNADTTSAPVWRSDHAPPALRCPRIESLSANETHLTAMWDVPAILGDSLPTAKYDFGYAIRTADGRVLEFINGTGYLTADRSPPSTDLSVIAWTARSRVTGIGPRILSTVVTLRNSGPRVLALQYGACNVAVRLYRTPDRRGAPVWRSEHRQPPESSSEYACPAILYGSYLPPGDSLVFPLAVPMYEVLADSLPAGRYYVGVETSVASGRVSGGSNGADLVTTLAAGVVDLTRAPDRLPTSRLIDGLSYSATSRVVRGAGGADTIRTLVLVTNTTNVRREADVNRDCPVVMLAYRSAALRDSLPLQRSEPYPNVDCWYLPHHFALEPGGSWVFSNDVPMATARAALRAGRYWLTALIGSGAILAAGDVEIR